MERRTAGFGFAVHAANITMAGDDRSFHPAIRESGNPISTIELVLTLTSEPSHRAPRGWSDRIALFFTRTLRWLADAFFAKRYGHRAIVLETVAAVPGMVGATLTHMQCLRRMVDDDGWIRTLLEEAENERMHLMTFIAIAKPTAFERLAILFAQWLFYLGYFTLYLVSRRTAHRVVGYFEEEAVLSYTLYLQEIDAGRMANVAAPAIARHYWQLASDATLRDVVLVVRADEAHHRDVNHALASRLAGELATAKPVAPYPQHAQSIRPDA
jgi:ubiquinol oxidase